MNAVMKFFRFCGNSLSYITAFNLHLVGGPKFPDLLAYLASCGMRAAYKTLVGYNEQHNELLRLAVEELPLAIHRYKACTPSGWDSPALCTNLFVFASHNVCSGLADPGLSRVRNVQAYLYKKLSERMPDPFIAWGKLIKDRFSLCTEQYDSEMCFSSYDCNFSEFQPELSLFKEFCSVLLTLNPSIRMRVIKTIVNSWSTSRRLHEPKIH